MTTIAEACRELTHLCACLPPALTKDATGTKGTQITAGSVYNPDVMHAMEILRREVPAATMHAASVVGEPWRHRPVSACLTTIPRLGVRMTQLGYLSEHAQLEDGTRWWVRLTKSALGLRTPDIPLGYPCPHHDEEAILLAAGSEGFLRRTRDGMTIEWEHAARVYCPVCHASWGATEWLHLGRVLQSTS